MSQEAPETFGQQQPAPPEEAEMNVDQVSQRDTAARESKAKVDKFLTEQNLDALGTFGEGHNTFDIAPVAKIQVDPSCTIENVHVLQDYSCVLTCEDVTFQMISQIRVFKMQLLERSDKKKWTVWTANGKQQEATDEEIDTENFTKKIFEFYNMHDAVSTFEKKFVEKTSNKWSEREFFRQRQGKFNLENKEKRKKEMKQATQLEDDFLAMVAENASAISPSLDSAVVDMIKAAADPGLVREFMKDLSLDLKKIPIGKLTLDKIKRAHQVLREIQKHLMNDAKNTQTLVSLTNDFYNAVPHDFGVKMPPVINHLLRVKEKARLLEQLEDIVALEQVYMTTFKRNLAKMNPWEAFFSEFCIKVSKLESEMPSEYPTGLFDSIYKSINNTQADAHKDKFDVQLRQVYVIGKPAQKLRFFPFETKVHNKFLLWHGAQAHSLPSILKDGVRLPNAESAETGYAFGKGLYFTDCFSHAISKSFGQTKPGSSQRCFALLSEVALGDMHRSLKPHLFKHSAPMYCHSVHGVGEMKPDQKGIIDLKQPGPKFRPSEETYDTPKALFLNTGKMVSNPEITVEDQKEAAFKYNEYVVFDEAQVNLAYLVDVEVVFK